MPEFWFQLEVWISTAKTDAKLATKNTRIVDVRLTCKIFALYLQFCASLSIALKLVLRRQ